MTPPKIGERWGATLNLESSETSRSAISYNLSKYFLYYICKEELFFFKHPYSICYDMLCSNQHAILKFYFQSNPKYPYEEGGLVSRSSVSPSEKCILFFVYGHLYTALVR